MGLFDDIANNHVLRTRKETPKGEESTIQMKHIKVHLDVIAVSLIIIVSLYKIYDLSRK